MHQLKHKNWCSVWSYIWNNMGMSQVGNGSKPIEPHFGDEHPAQTSDSLVKTQGIPWVWTGFDGHIWNFFWQRLRRSLQEMGCEHPSPVWATWRAGCGTFWLLNYICSANITWFSWKKTYTIYIYIIVGLEHEFYFSIQLGFSSSQLTFSPSFFRGVGLNHQPAGTLGFNMIHKTDRFHAFLIIGIKIE